MCLLGAPPTGGTHSVSQTALAHQGSQATFFLGRMRATSAGSCDAGASGVELGGGTAIGRVG
jgi:hypothetical protein